VGSNPTSSVAEKGSVAQRTPSLLAQQSPPCIGCGPSSRVDDRAGKRETEGNNYVAECRLNPGRRISWPIHVVLTVKSLKRVIIFYPGGGLGKLDVRSRRQCSSSKRAKMGGSSAMTILDGPKTQARVRRGVASLCDREDSRHE
jgi:hypothetical protein